MTRRIGNNLIIEKEEPSICHACGNFAELRPYGINGERICCECGRKNPKEATKQSFRQLFDIELPESFFEENPM